MVKKRMAMRMVTIFVALIVCGMFFPDLARGAGLSVNTEVNVDVGNVVVGEEKITSVGITNESNDELKIWLALNKDAGCPEEYFIYTGPNIYPDDPDIQFKPGDTLNVTVTFKPSDVGECKAFLQITPIGSTGVEGAQINFTATGIEKPAETETLGNIIIGGIDTEVEDRPLNDQHNAPFVGKIIEECEATAYTCGQLGRCVSLLTGELWRQGRLTCEEKSKLRRAAGKAEIRKMLHEMETSRRLKSAERSGCSSHWGWWWRH